jgi:hypothetical protein
MSMAINESRGIKIVPRSFDAEGHCRGVVEWLNEVSDDPAHRRIRSLLRNVRILGSNWVEVDDGDGGAIAYAGSDKEYRTAWKQVWGILRRYKFCLMIQPFADWMNPVCVPYSTPQGRWKKGWPPPGFDDAVIIVHLLYMGEGRGLAKINECECGCGKWFFKRFSHQKFFSAKCRDKIHKSFPRWQEYRRKKAREYYWLHKKKNTK